MNRTLSGNSITSPQTSTKGEIRLSQGIGGVLLARGLQTHQGILLGLPPMATQRGLAKGPLSPMPIIDTPIDQIALDLVDPLRGPSRAIVIC